jgi:hypothetical protein
MGVVLRYMGTFKCDGASRLRARRQAMTDLFVPCNPHVRVFLQEFVNGSRACWQIVLGGLSSILHLGLGLTMYLYDHIIFFA